LYGHFIISFGSRFSFHVINLKQLWLPMSQTTGPKQKQENQDNHADAADGVKAPLPAMRPNRKTPHKRYNDKYRKNNHPHHDFAPPFWPTRLT
jgi:hypothetical protein